jgi:hypothetical protein
VDGVGEQLLARTGLTLNEHGGVAPRDFLDDPEELLERRALADEMVGRSDAPAQIVQRLPHHLVLERLRDLEFKFFDLERFLDVVVRAEPHGLDRVFHGAIRGHHNHRGQRVGGLGGPQHIQTALSGQGHIRDHHPEELLADQPDRGFGVGSFGHAMPRALERLGNALSEGVMVLDYEDFLHTATASCVRVVITGRWTENWVCFPGSLVTSIVP